MGENTFTKGKGGEEQSRAEAVYEQGWLCGMAAHPFPTPNLVEIWPHQDEITPALPTASLQLLCAAPAQFWASGFSPGSWGAAPRGLHGKCFSCTKELDPHLPHCVLVLVLQPHISTFLTGEGISATIPAETWGTQMPAVTPDPMCRSRGHAWSTWTFLYPSVSTKRAGEVWAGVVSPPSLSKRLEQGPPCPAAAAMGQVHAGGPGDTHFCGATGSRPAAGRRRCGVQRGCPCP